MGGAAMVIGAAATTGSLRSTVTRWSCRRSAPRNGSTWWRAQATYAQIPKALPAPW